VRSLGRIVRLQVQQASLKVGVSPRRYDPTPLLAVPTLRLTPEGVVGLTADGETILDVHHRDHPSSKNRGGENGLSIGFTAHYVEMRDRFGEHLADGLAAENLLVETDHVVHGDELTGGLVIVGDDGTRLPLHALLIAAPCVEFTRYALRWPDEARLDRRVTEALQFLDAGMRGYYASYSGPPAVVEVGDRVLLQ
jgi:hypothetical protein